MTSLTDPQAVTDPLNHFKSKLKACVSDIDGRTQLCQYAFCTEDQGNESSKRTRGCHVALPAIVLVDPNKAEDVSAFNKLLPGAHNEPVTGAQVDRGLESLLTALGLPVENTRGATSFRMPDMRSSLASAIDRLHGCSNDKVLEAMGPDRGDSFPCLMLLKHTTPEEESAVQCRQRAAQWRQQEERAAKRQRTGAAGSSQTNTFISQQELRQMVLALNPQIITDTAAATEGGGAAGAAAGAGPAAAGGGAGNGGNGGNDPAAAATVPVPAAAAAGAGTSPDGAAQGAGTGISTAPATHSNDAAGPAARGAVPVAAAAGNAAAPAAGSAAAAAVGGFSLPATSLSGSAGDTQAPALAGIQQAAGATFSLRISSPGGGAGGALGPALAGSQHAAGDQIPQHTSGSAPLHRSVMDSFRRYQDEQDMQQQRQQEQERQQLEQQVERLTAQQRRSQAAAAEADSDTIPAAALLQVFNSMQEYSHSVKAVLGDEQSMASMGQAREALTKYLTYSHSYITGTVQPAIDSELQQLHGSPAVSAQMMLSLRAAVSQCYALVADELMSWGSTYGIRWAEIKPGSALHAVKQTAASLKADIEACSRGLEQCCGQALIQYNIMISTMVQGDFPPDALLHIILTKFCLGNGGFGEVYYGWCTTTGQPVAIKKLSLATFLKKKYGDEEDFKRFLTHAELNAHSLSGRKGGHDNVVQMLGMARYACHDASDEGYYLALEYVANCRPSQLPFSPDQAIDIGVQALRGIEHIHSLTDIYNRPLIHRDIKIENLLRSPSGCVKICDFGLSKIQFTNMSLKGDIWRGPGGESMVGTEGTMASEVATSSHDGCAHTPKSDIYSWAVMMLELLCGHQASEAYMRIAGAHGTLVNYGCLLHMHIKKKPLGAFEAELRALGGTFMIEGLGKYLPSSAVRESLGWVWGAENAKLADRRPTASQLLQHLA